MLRDISIGAVSFILTAVMVLASATQGQGLI